MVRIGNTKNDGNHSTVYQGIDLTQRIFSGYRKTSGIETESLGIGDKPPGIGLQSPEVELETLGIRLQTPKIDVETLGIGHETLGIRL